MWLYSALTEPESAVNQAIGGGSCHCQEPPLSCPPGAVLCSLSTWQDVALYFLKMSYMSILRKFVNFSFFQFRAY